MRRQLDLPVPVTAPSQRQSTVAPYKVPDALEASRHTDAIKPYQMQQQRTASQQLLRQQRTPEQKAAVQKLLSGLPCACQALCPSPYLDPSLFTYNSSAVSPLIRSGPRSGLG